MKSFFNLDSFSGGLYYSLIVILICWIISRIFRLIILFFLKKGKTKEKFGETRLKFFRNSLRFIFGIIALTVIILNIPVFREKANYIFSGAGILAAIIGFAAQSALSNLIAGVFIVIFKPFRVGDYIKLDEERLGIVEDITLRHTVINNFENNRLIIPNSVISSEGVINHNIDEEKVLTFNRFLISNKANIDDAKKIITEEADKLESIIDSRTQAEIDNNDSKYGIEVIDISETTVTLRAVIWVNEPFRAFRVKYKLKENVHKRFLTEHIKLPEFNLNRS